MCHFGLFSTRDVKIQLHFAISKFDIVKPTVRVQLLFSNLFFPAFKKFKSQFKRIYWSLLKNNIRIICTTHFCNNMQNSRTGKQVKKETSKRIQPVTVERQKMTHERRNTHTYTVAPRKHYWPLDRNVSNVWEATTGYFVLLWFSLKSD